jgi:hypothetical protein
MMRFQTTLPATCCLLPDSHIFGPRFDIEFPVDALGGGAEKVTKVFSPAVVGTCLLSEEESKNAALLPKLPELSFRAAAVANFYWRQEKQGSAEGYKWKIGKLHWLPKVDKATKKE